MSKVLITGANGFIGSNLCDALVEKGYQVIGLLKNGDNPRWYMNKKVKIIYGDITDKYSLQKHIAASLLTKALYIRSNHCGSYISVS